MFGKQWTLASQQGVSLRVRLCNVLTGIEMDDYSLSKIQRRGRYYFQRHHHHQPSREGIVLAETIERANQPFLILRIAKCFSYLEVFINHTLMTTPSHGKIRR